jgi:uncharacterized protein (DUF4415 family)
MRDEYDFSTAQRAKKLPHLARLQTEAKNKTVITVMLDADVFNALRSKAETEGLDYQALINRALREALTIRPLDEAALRRILREAWAAH